MLTYIEGSDEVELESTNDKLPIKGTELSAGIDITSNNDNIITISPGKRSLINSGIKIKKCPENCYIRVIPRSELSLKNIDIGAGVINSDYRGEIKILMINNGDEDFAVVKGLYIAQLIIEKIYENKIKVNKSNTSNKTSIREDKGLGSSDKNS